MFLKELGFRQFRVRYHEHDNAHRQEITARIEVETGEIQRLLEPVLRERVVLRFQEIGFSYVTVDLRGYRTGSMNESLSQ
jgi:uncharacterized protein